MQGSPSPSQTRDSNVERALLLLKGPPGRDGFLFHDGFDQPIHQAAPGLLGLLEGRRVVERWKPAIVHWMDDAGHFFNHILHEFAGVPRFEPVATEIAAIRRMEIPPAAKNRCMFHYFEVLAGSLERTLSGSGSTAKAAVPVPSSVREISLNGPWTAYHREAGGDYAEREMELPVNWQLVPGIDDYAGSMRFTRTVEVAPELYGRRLLLSFLGVDYYADVWVNGHYAGGHEGCFAPFSFDISSLLDYGEVNVIRVAVTSPNEPAGDGTHVSSGWDDFRAESSFPNRKTIIKGTLGHHDAKRGGAWSSLTSQDANTGGIWSDVTLCVRDPIHLDLSGPKLTTLSLSPPASAGDLVASVEVVVPLHNTTGATIEARVGVTLAPANFDGDPLELSTTVSLAPGESSVTLFHPQLGPVRAWQTWDQGPPHLYSVHTIVDVDGEMADEHHLETGLRVLSTTPIGESPGPDGSFVVNGVPLFVRGTNLLPTYWLSEYHRDKVADDFRLLRDAGFNAVMIHCVVAPEELYRAANRLGVLVVQMFPLQWSYEQSLEFVDRVTRQVRDLTELLYNEPSVVSYDTHNEPDMRMADGLDNRLVDLQLHATFRDADPHRWATTFSGGNHAYPGQFYDLRDDNSFATLPARFEHAEYQGTRISRHRNMPTEFGIQAMPHVALFEELLAEDRVKDVLKRLRTDAKWKASGGESWEEAEEVLDAAKKTLGGGSWGDALHAFDWTSLWRFDRLKDEIAQDATGPSSGNGGLDERTISKRWALLLLEVLHYGAFKGENFWFGRWKPASTLTGFVQASQDRQYRLHKEAIETYMNAGVLGPMVGYFSFMFRDCDRQAPTWGVVDATGVPKKAYRAYVESNQPVRVSLPRALQRPVKLPGDPWFGAQPGWRPVVREPWTEAELIIANDTSATLSGRIEVWLDDPGGRTIPLADGSGGASERLQLPVEVGAGGGFSYFERYGEDHGAGAPASYVVPEDLAGGTYHLKARVVSEAGEALSTNSYELIVPDTAFPVLDGLTDAHISALLDGAEGRAGFHYWQHGHVTYRARPGVKGFLAGAREASQRGIDLYETTQGEYFFAHILSELEGLEGSAPLLETIWRIRSEMLSPAEKTAVLMRYLEIFGAKAEERRRARESHGQTNEEDLS